MDAGLIAGIISAVATLLGALATVIVTIIKYRGAKTSADEAEKKEFYLYTAYNTVIEAERLFGDGNGAEKKKYALTKLQNEAISVGIKWDQKLASKCIEQAVALRNDYKNAGADVNMEEVIKMEIENEIATTKKEAEDAKKEVTEGILAAFEHVSATADVIKNNLTKDKAENTAYYKPVEEHVKPTKSTEEETVIAVVED